MRLTDDRYTQQRFRLEIALRMIRHEARTATIRESTGVTEDRIRKLYRAYFSDRGNRQVYRKRGKSPQQTYCLTRNLRVRTDAAVFAGVLHSLGGFDQSADPSCNTLVAARVCDAYELFIKLRPSHYQCEFTFEHAWFLIRVLRLRTEITSAQCSRCAGFTLRDIYAPSTSLCPLCETMRLVNARNARHPHKRATNAEQGALPPRKKRCVDP